MNDLTEDEKLVTSQDKWEDKTPFERYLKEQREAFEKLHKIKHAKIRKESC